MAKEQKEHTTIGFNRSTIATIMLVVGVASALAVWKDRGSDEAKAAAVHDSRVDGHETRILSVETEVKSLDKRMDSTEKTQIAIQKDQEAILHGQREMKEQQSKFADLQIEQIKSNAELHAYIRTIEKID